MKAFLTHKRCGTCFIIRIGPGAVKRPDPWERKIEGQLGCETCGRDYDADICTWEGLERPLPPDMVEAAVRVALLSYAEVHLDREGLNPRHIVFTSQQGKIHMSKSFSQEHMNKSHKARGVYDKAAVLADWDAIRAAIASDDVVLITRRISQPVNEASDGSGAKSSYAFLEWKHK